MQTDTTQRWHRGRASYRPAGELFNPAGYSVESIPDDTTAAAFVRLHHYSASYPAARFRFGLFSASGELHGVAVFSVPAQAKVTTNWLQGPPAAHVDLGRFVLLDAVAANGETWMLARCFDLLKRSGIEGVVSFADPSLRTDAAGQRVFGGHVGTIYQAKGAVYAGRSKARTLRLLPDGTVFSDRTASKVRKLDKGSAAAVAFLVGHGARPLGDQDPALWLSTELARVTRPLRHPGNLRYLWTLGKGQLQPGVQALPYLKARDLFATTSPALPC